MAANTSVLSPDAPANRILSSAARFRKHLLTGGCLALVLGSGAWLWLRWSHVTENDAKVMADMVTISSRVDGWVAERPVTDGDRVARGQTLAALDQRTAALQVEELKAKAASLEMEAERVRAQLAVTEGATLSDLAAAEFRLHSAQAGLHATEAGRELARLDFDRNKPLAEGAVISRQSWDQTRTSTRESEEKTRQAEAQLREAQANVSGARARRGDAEVLRRQLAQLAEDLAQVRAQIGQKEVELDDRVIRSPVDGVVDQKFVEPGEYVIPGQRLVLVHDPKSVWIEVHLKETKLEGISPGQPVEVSVDAYPGRRFAGRVERIGASTTSQFALLPSPNPSGHFTKVAQRVPVRIAVDQPGDNPLRPGMMVEVDIDRAGT